MLIDKDYIQKNLLREQEPSSLPSRALDGSAEGFIRMRLRASKGINGIVRDLKGHQIDAYAIPGFPDAFLEEQGSQLDNAIRLLERKPPRAKNKKQAAYAKLIRNGFSSSVASSAVKSWIAEREDQ